MSIGQYALEMPLDWSILVCDEDYSDIELLPLTSISERGFHTMVYNPFKHMVPKPLMVNVTNIFAEVKWYVPKMKNGNILVVPLDDTPTPPCALFVKDGTKLPEVIDIGTLFE